MFPQLNQGSEGQDKKDPKMEIYLSTCATSSANPVPAVGSISQVAVMVTADRRGETERHGDMPQSEDSVANDILEIALKAQTFGAFSFEGPRIGKRSRRERDTKSYGDLGRSPEHFHEIPTPLVF